MSRARVYLAGPEVFLPDAEAVGAEKRRLCGEYGFEGLFPLDAEIEAVEARQMALAISAANEALIRSCQLVIANMTPFRGPSADVGTAYEMGFARGLGLPVFAYTNADSGFAARVTEFMQSTGQAAPAPGLDAEGMTIEPFGLVDNLMLVGALGAQNHEPVRTAAPFASRFRALSAFEQCLQAARRTAGSADARQQK
jgi:nucleoside 2-deoxyribosyltransferase